MNRSQKNLKEFKKTFQKYKAKLSTYFTEEKKPKTWDFQEVLVFKRYDSFLTRLNTISEFFNTAQQFQKLEKVEIGGIRGKLLTNHVKKIFVEFGELYATFGMRTYDALNPKDHKFLRDYEKFNSKLYALDRKLGAILTRAFEDCTESQSVFRLLHVFGGLVDRKLIALELSDKMPVLVQMLNNEMDESKLIFKKQEERISETGKALTDRNMPPITGQLKFAKVRGKNCQQIYQKSFAGAERQDSGKHKGFQEPQPSNLLQRGCEPGLIFILFCILTKVKEILNVNFLSVRVLVFPSFMFTDICGDWEL